MQAYASVSGGVIFVPGHVIETKSSCVSYRDFAEQETQQPDRARVFGKRPAADAETLKEVA